jgi:hypothetical protein
VELGLPIIGYTKGVAINLSALSRQQRAISAPLATEYG